jgi:hypothetical protein
MNAKKPMTVSACPGVSVQPHSNSGVNWLIPLLCMVSAAGCGVPGEDTPFDLEVPQTQEAGVATGEEMDLSGLSVNGLSVNGLSVNGLSVNGLSVNGLSVNGLSTGVFKDWFEENPAERDMVMKYIVACAVPSGQSRIYTSLATGRVYRWNGVLGLAPGWSGGAQPTLSEQQVVTACLAAHANKFGMHIYLSVLGRGGTGVEIPYTFGELWTYGETEACFFGNVFNDAGIFAANDRDYLNISESSPRACGMISQSQSTDCPPIVHVGACSTYCTLNSAKTYYTSCTYNGVTYKPITTRIRSSDIYTCGDGVCQFTEQCGTGTEYNNCYADCGACPP